MEGRWLGRYLDVPTTSGVGLPHAMCLDHLGDGLLATQILHDARPEVVVGRRPAPRPGRLVPAMGHAFASTDAALPRTLGVSDEETRP